MIDFVPKYIGLGHVSRQTVIKNHKLAFAKVIFGNDRGDITVCVTDETCTLKTVVINISSAVHIQCTKEDYLLSR